MIPERELEFIRPLDGVKTMLELGNKANHKGVYKHYFESLGIAHTSVDWNGKDGALALDLRKPLDLGRFDMVTNIGTSEHVDDQEAVWRNIANATARYLVCVTPIPGDWPGHGLFYPSQQFYFAFAQSNGMQLQKFGTHGAPGRRCNYARMLRRDDTSFNFPRYQIQKAPGK